MIRSKSRKLLKESRGFTMIEMIITVMITAIFFSSVVVILPAVTKSYNKVISLNYARQIATSVSDAVAEQLTYAKDVKIVETAEGKSALSYSYQGSLREIVLKENGTIPGLMYDDGYYMDKKVVLGASIEVKDSGNTVCTLDIKVYNKEGTPDLILKKERVIRLYGI